MLPTGLYLLVSEIWVREMTIAKVEISIIYHVCNMAASESTIFVASVWACKRDTSTTHAKILFLLNRTTLSLVKNQHSIRHKIM